MPAEYTVAEYTIKQWDAAFMAVAEHWRRKGYHEQRRPLGRSLFGRSLEYRFYEEGREIVRWELTPKPAGVKFVMRLRDADMYDMPDWDRFAWQTKEAIWRDVVTQIRKLWPTQDDLPSAGQPADAPEEQQVAVEVEAVPAEEAPVPTERAHGAKKPRVSVAMRALAEKAFELRKANPAMSKVQVAAWINANCTAEEKSRLKRGWGTGDPVTQYNVNDAWSRMCDVEGWPAWSEDRLPVKD